MGHVHHIERCPRNLKLLAWVHWYDVNGPVDIVLVSGARTDAEQLEDWVKGRKQLPDGSWVVIDDAEVVTEALGAKSSAHGHDSAVDFLPVKAVYVTGGVRTVYLADLRRESPEDYAEARRRFRLVIDTIGDFDLESGERFPRPDLPHVQDRDWRTNPLGPGVAA